MWLLASDVDNTLTGDRAALDELTAHLSRLRAKGTLFLVLSTGRRLDQVVTGFAREGLPRADAIISQIGTEIHLPPYREEMAPLSEWQAWLEESFSRQRALAFLEGIEGLTLQPPIFNTPLKVSAFLDKAPDPDAAAAEIQARVAATTAGDAYQVVWSSGMHLDIIPTAAGKGKAIRFLLDYLKLNPEEIIVAGDSGNDRSMFETFGKGIVVANAQPELKAATAEMRSEVYRAEAPFAAGVLEGLQRFGLLADGQTGLREGGR